MRIFYKSYVALHTEIYYGKPETTWWFGTYERPETTWCSTRKYAFILRWRMIFN